MHWLVSCSLSSSLTCENLVDEGVSYPVEGCVRTRAGFEAKPRVLTIGSGR